MPRFDKLLVLDLDETLVHARDQALDRPADRRIAGYHVYDRPGLRPFLERVTELFTVGVWTSSGEGYAHALVARIFPDPALLRFVYARDRCTYRRDLESHEVVWLKDLRKLRRMGFTRSQVVFVDDSREKIARSYGNLVRVAPYEGAEDDRELDALAIYLELVIGPCPDVRALEKRGWRETVRR